MLKKLFNSWSNFKKKKDIKDNIQNTMCKFNSNYFLNIKVAVGEEEQKGLIDRYTEIVMRSITSSSPDKAIRIQLIDKALMFGYSKTLVLKNYVYSNDNHKIYVSNEMPRYMLDLYEKSNVLQRLLNLPQDSSRETVEKDIDALASQYLYYMYGLWAIEKAYYNHKDEWIQDLIFISMVLAEHKFRNAVSLGYVITNEQYKELLNLIARISEPNVNPSKEINDVLDHIFGK